MLNDMQLMILEGYINGHLKPELDSIGVEFTHIKQEEDQGIVSFEFEVPEYGSASVMMFEVMIVRARIENIGSEIISALIKTLSQYGVLGGKRGDSLEGWGVQGEPSEPTQQDIEDMFAGFDAFLGSKADPE